MTGNRHPTEHVGNHAGFLIYSELFGMSVSFLAPTNQKRKSVVIGNRMTTHKNNLLYKYTNQVYLQPSRWWAMHVSYLKTMNIENSRPK